MSKTRWICFNGLGIGLFVALSLCLQVPVFENYYLCLGYFVMMVYCYFLGPASGAIVGSLGVVLYCLLINGLRGMPGWAVGNIVIGILVGLTCFMTSSMKKGVRVALISLSIVVATAVGMLGVKSGVEAFIYAQPFVLRVAKNIYAFVADVVVLLVGYPLCLALEPVIWKLVRGKGGTSVSA